MRFKDLSIGDTFDDHHPLDVAAPQEGRVTRFRKTDTRRCVNVATEVPYIVKKITMSVWHVEPGGTVCHS